MRFYPGLRVKVVNVFWPWHRYLISKEGVVVGNAQQDEFLKTEVIPVELFGVVEPTAHLFLPQHLVPVVPPFVPQAEDIIEIDKDVLHDLDCPLFEPLLLTWDGDKK